MFKNLKVRARLLIVAVLFAVPIVGMLVVLAKETQRAVERVEVQQTAVEYVMPLRKLLENVQQHRGLANGLLSGDQSFRDKLQAAGTAVRLDFGALERVDARLGVALGVADQFADVRKEWGALEAGLSSFSVARSFEAHTSIVAHITQLLSRVANRGGLVQDDEIDSYHAMDAIVFKLPALSEELGQARAYGTAAIAEVAAANRLAMTEAVGVVPEPKDVDAPRKMLLGALHSRARQLLVDTRATLQFGFEANPRFDASLRPMLEHATSNVEEFLGALDQRVLVATTPQVNAADFFTLSTKGLDGVYKLFDSVASIHRERLGTRLEQLRSRRVELFGWVGAMLALSLVMLLLVIRSITSGLAELADAAERISLGELDVEITIQGRDEFGVIAERFRRMQVSLRSAMEMLDSDELG